MRVGPRAFSAEAPNLPATQMVVESPYFLP